MHVTAYVPCIFGIAWVTECLKNLRLEVDFYEDRLAVYAYYLGKSRKAIW